MPFNFGYRRFFVRPPEWHMDGEPQGTVTAQWITDIENQIKLAEQELAMLREERIKLMHTEGVAREACAILAAHFIDKEATKV